jgi:hypothetical protein
MGDHSVIRFNYSSQFEDCCQSPNNDCMKKFVIERNLPGAGNLSAEELKAFARTSCEAAGQPGKPHRWIQSFITEDKIYCIHIAESAEVLREHAKNTRLPVNTITEIKFIIDPLTGDC